MSTSDRDELLESLMNTTLYSIGAAVQDNHADLVEEVVALAERIESAGLEAWAEQEGVTLETALETLVTGLALRYYRALSG